VRFDEGTAFPGYNALLPVIATAILIGTIPIWPRFFNDLSNNRTSQWLGAISYPLYLWHWPALVLPAAALDRPLRIRERLLCIAITVILAHFTSKYIEQPLRHREFSAKKIYGFFASTTALSLIAAIVIIASSSDLIKVAGTSYKFNLEQVMQKPSIYGDGCHVNYGENESEECLYGDLK
jgi:peptidoglycan/LPS O-acetylase OafA/YrhL